MHGHQDITLKKALTSKDSIVDSLVDCFMPSGLPVRFLRLSSDLCILDRNLQRKLNVLNNRKEKNMKTQATSIFFNLFHKFLFQSVSIQAISTSCGLQKNFHFGFPCDHGEELHRQIQLLQGDTVPKNLGIRQSALQSAAF